MRKIEIRYPNDPEAQKQWESICIAVDNAEKYRKRYIRDYRGGKIKKTIFNAARYLSYTK